MSSRLFKKSSQVLLLPYLFSHCLLIVLFYFFPNGIVICCLIWNTIEARDKIIINKINNNTASFNDFMKCQSN